MTELINELTARCGHLRRMSQRLEAYGKWADDLRATGLAAELRTEAESLMFITNKLQESINVISR